ncbi:hypothetical protein ZEAMMB73_Zm00001d050909 [Zea mays]|jgi:hypothetical protein|uniref:Uncharacterized protein n=1 Tax=Zea mays TaxID=4577 RepID=K7TXP3_MAIZE|nr:hypothetical protein ZEAMMB73_Zm00001d050909 [Zea mays]
MASGGRTMESVRWGELSSGLRRRKTRGHGRPEVESRGTASLRERAKVARHGSRRARREALAGRRWRWARWKRPRRRNPSAVQGAGAVAMASTGSSGGKAAVRAGNGRNTDEPAMPGSRARAQPELGSRTRADGAMEMETELEDAAACHGRARAEGPGAQRWRRKRSG